MGEYTLERLTDIAIALSAEKDIDILLDRILNEAMDITSCDGGTVYILEGDKLYFRNVITKSKGTYFGGPGNPEPPMPPITLARTHVCACAAIDNRKINIEDVYLSEEFDFTGARKFDESTGYRTGSMLVLPMEDEKGHVIGVLQLINAQNEAGERVAFAPKYEDIISALTSLAAVSLNNRRLLKSVQDILHSFVEVMVEAVDARSSYNANHTRHMVLYAEKFLDYCHENNIINVVNPEKEDAFLMSVWLHDIGKLVIPIELMDKASRLGDREDAVRNRLTIGMLQERIRSFEKPDERQAALENEQKLKGALTLIESANNAGFLTDEMLEELRSFSGLTCMGADGERIPILTEDELDGITVRKGTLTVKERGVMESHVVYTARMLAKMKFDGEYSSVPIWASDHHEYINGTGYPNQKKGEEIPSEVRLITILDIYDALTAEDRPYKPAMPKDKAIKILREMVGEGKIDGDLLELFVESKAWE